MRSKLKAEDDDFDEDEVSPGEDEDEDEGDEGAEAGEDEDGAETGSAAFNLEDELANFVDTASNRSGSAAPDRPAPSRVKSSAISQVSKGWDMGNLLEQIESEVDAMDGGIAAAWIC